jgi:hypothetical protein
VTPQVFAVVSFNTSRVRNKFDVVEMSLFMKTGQELKIRASL